MVPVLGHITHRRNETRDTFTLEIELPQAQPLPFEPGQFNMLYIFGTGEVPISISGDPARPEALVHTTRAVGTVTRAMQRLRVGDHLGVRGPFGRGWPLAEAIGRDVLLLAGGIGLAPLRPVLLYLLAHRPRYRRVVLLYGARTPDALLYRRDVRRWRTLPDIAVHVTVDQANGAWNGHVGVITTLLPQIRLDPDRTVAFLCGPEVMMHVAVQALRRRGIGAEQIHVSMERNMHCGTGLCGHCQYSQHFVCKDGPVFRFDEIEDYFNIRTY